MADDRVLRYDADESPIGDRVAASGWARPSRVRLVEAAAPGITVFANGGVVYAAPHVQVGVSVNGRALEAHQITLDDDYLVGEGPIVGVVEPRQAVLDAFVQLAVDPSASAILKYAQDYGMLGLRVRERAAADMVYPNLPWVGEQLAPFIGYQLAPGLLREPLGLWRRVLREIRAAYMIAARLRNDQPVARAAWEPLRGIVQLPLGPDDAPEDDPAAETIGGFVGVAAVPWIPVDPTTLDGQREALAVVIGAWLAIGAVRPAIAWGGPGRDDDPVMALGVSTLFGGLVLELLLAIAGRAGIAICSACGQPYVPRRRLPSGRFGEPPRSYCPACQAKHAAQNAAAQRWRDKHPDYFRNRRAEASGSSGSSSAVVGAGARELRGRAPMAPDPAGLPRPASGCSLVAIVRPTPLDGGRSPGRSATGGDCGSTREHARAMKVIAGARGSTREHARAMRAMKATATLGWSVDPERQADPEVGGS